MKNFLRICLACFCMLALSHTYLQAQAPVIDQLTLFGSGGVVSPATSPTGIATNTTVLLRFDQQIFDSSGNFFTITNITSVFSVSPVVPFGAIINGTGRFVTITFTSELAANTLYTVTLGAGDCQNAALEACMAQSISFRTSSVVTVTAPTLNVCANGVYGLLGPIVITEVSATSFGQGNNQILEINAPTGFEFDTNIGYNVSSSGSDVSNLSITVAIGKIIVIYDVGTSYFGIDAITISSIRIRKLTGIATGALLRTGGNAIQAGNRLSDASRPIFATVNSIAVPTAPTLPIAFTSSNLSICSGFFITDATSFTIAGGTSAYFYDASNTLIHTTTTASVSRQNLGYTGANNTTLGTKQFYVTTRNNTAPFCESAKVPFTITITPNPVVNLTLTSGGTTICLPNQSIFTAVGTVGATYTFLWNGSNATAMANGTLSTTNTLNDTYTTNATSITTGTLSVRATVAGNCNTTTSPAISIIVNPASVVDFVWTNATSYPNDNVPVSLRDGTTFGGYVGTSPSGTFNPTGTGVYSGTAVVGTNFYPSIAPLNLPITITYTYTDANGCVGTNFIQLTVFDASNSINNLIPLYCASAPSAAVLTPSAGILNSPTPSPLVAQAPNTAYINGQIYDASFPSIYANKYTFPNYLGGNINLGIVWNATLSQYTFNAASPAILAVIGTNEFVTIPVIMAVFRTNMENFGFFPLPITRCVFVLAFVRVYKNPVLDVNLPNLTEFCPATSALTILPKVFLGNPSVISNPPAGSTVTLEYYLTSNPATIATLPLDIINPTVIPAGDYTLRYTYTSPQSCGNILERTFKIKTSLSPTLEIRNSASSVISTACVSDISIKIFTSVAGIATISKVAGGTTTANIGIGETIFTIASGNFSGAGVYNITITNPTTGTICGGTSSVSTVTIYNNPVPTFTFSGASTLAICYNATSFVVTPGAGLPVGSGQVFVKKTTGGAIGQLFGAGVINLNPLTDFNANSGVGAGTYDISYVYTATAGGCIGSSTIKQLTINPAPDLSFALNTYEICNKATRDNVILTPNWANAVAPNVLLIASGSIKIYAAMTGGTVLNQFSATNTIITNNITVANPNIVNDFYVEYEYTDNNGCTGVSPRRKLTINPLPAITFNFTNPLLNEFCYGDGNSAFFTANVTGVNVSPFNAMNGKITLRANTASTPTTPAFTATLPDGVMSFNPSIIFNISRVGEYFVDYTYTDTKQCITTVTSPILLKLRALPAPDFTFSSGLNSIFSICASVNNVVLTPSVSNTSIYGVGTFNASYGTFTIKKSGILITTLAAGINNFNPTSAPFVSSIGGIPGDYDITYTYSVAGACSKISNAYTLRINPLPNPTFSFAATFVGTPAFCIDATSFNLLPLVNTGAVVTPTNGFFTIRKISPALGTAFNISNGINTIDLTLASFTGVGTYEVFYNYTDANTCTNQSPVQTFIINPLPVTTISFVAPIDNKFCANEPAGTPFLNLAYVSGAGAFDPTKSSFTITRGSFSITIPALTGTNTFDPSFLASTATGAGFGSYTVTHKYEDTNGCEQITLPLTFEIYALPEPAFKFQVTPTTTADDLNICADINLVQLLPTITNPTDYGVTAFTPSNGVFKFTLNAVVRTLPAGVNSFNPNVLFAGDNVLVIRNYIVTYTYTRPNFCSKETTITQILTINPLPIVSFAFAPATSVNNGYSVDAVTGNARICNDFNLITLLPSISVGTGITFSIVEISPVVPPATAPISLILAGTSITQGNLSIITTGIVQRVFNIKFIYTNGNGCVGESTVKTLTVIPVPKPLFTVAPQKCVNIPVLFDASTSIIQAQIPATPNDDNVRNNGYSWDFGDNTPVVDTTTQFIEHKFTTPGTFVVSLTITSVLGCSKTFSTNVTIGAIPVAGFTTAKFCQGDATAFFNTSTLIGTGGITTYAWTFGDGNTATVIAPLPLAPLPAITHTYSAPGRYTVRLTVTTNSLCTDFIERDVLIFPRVTPTAATPYKENFDVNNGFWLANGLIKSSVNPTQDIVGYSWAGGVPTGAKINASTTAGGAWSTKGNSNTFYPNERSYVESPCFNFTDPTLTKPMISMKVWYDTDRGSDGAVLLASINDGVSWNVVGTIGDGIEWYNTAGIIAQPGGQSVVNAWTGNTFTAFKVAKFSLDQFKGQASVRFRVAFGSNADNPVGQTFDGFAFDEVFIGNRNRIALLEHFTNAASSEANTENTFINNFPSAVAQNEIYNIQYHTNFPGNDPMNNDNTADPSARALFYSVSQVPRTAIDGVIENRKFSEWGTPVYNKRTLEAAPFEISVNFPNIPRELLNVTATIKALEPFSRRVIVQTVVVEQEILGTVFTTGNFGGLTFKNVVKKMIPNAAGTIINKTWLAGTQEILNLNWSPSKVYNGNKLVLVVFVQDETTKEIYQAAYFNVTTNPTGTDPATALDNTMLENEFVVYPNPAQNEVFTGFRQETAEDFSVILFDSYGKRIDAFSLTKGNKGLLINTEKYASGMYFIEITGENNIKARKKLVIAR